jgi:hypothetical protein
MDGFGEITAEETAKLTELSQVTEPIFMHA